MKIPEPKTGMERVLAAFGYTLKGLKYAAKSEAAFRQELVLVLIMSVVIFFMPLSPLWKALLFFANGSILIVELLNSAIEAVVDLASPEFHELAGRAKDMGSAAVFIIFVFTGIIWGFAIYSILI